MGMNTTRIRSTPSLSSRSIRVVWMSTRRPASKRLTPCLTAADDRNACHLSLLRRSCQRGWGSLYDALNTGTMDLARLERASGLLSAVERQPPWFAVDASVWPRCDAETSPARGYYPHPVSPFPRPADRRRLELLLARPGARALLELDRVRCACDACMPGENLNLVAAEQIRSWLHQAPPADAPAPIVRFDAGYESIQLEPSVGR